MEIGETFLAENRSALNKFVSMSRAVGLRPDYVQGGGGNTSVKLDDKRMAIKASGFKLSDISPENAYAVLDYQALREFYRTHEATDFADVEKDGSDFTKSQILPVEGLLSLRPSVEAGFHSILDRFVIHSHSVYANLATCSCEGKEIIARFLAFASYGWGYVPYTDPGIRLTFAIQDEIQRVVEETGHRPAAIFLQNHGLIVHHDDPKAALSIHSDVSERIAEAFTLCGNAFPPVRLRKLGEDLFRSDTALVGECLRSGNYDQSFFLDRPLYPDQLVFLAGTFRVGFDTLQSESCLANTDKGEILYSMNEQKAQAIEETIAAVLFIAENIQKNGYSLRPMGDAAKNFIANWESEKYRKSMAGK